MTNSCEFYKILYVIKSSKGGVYVENFKRKFYKILYVIKSSKKQKNYDNRAKAIVNKKS